MQRFDPRARARRRLAIATGSVCVWLLACASEPKPPPHMELPTSFSESGEAPRSERWWQDLEDPVLDDLVARALADNPGLLATWDRLAQARAVARAAGAALVPEITASARAAETQLDQPDLGAPGTLESDSYETGAALSYELDLWGRVRAVRDAARLDAEASEDDVATASIALSANVATTWYSLVESRGQVALLESQIETNEQVLELVTLRFRLGRVGAADVLRQRQLVEQRRGELTQARSREAVFGHALSVLVGQPPRALVLPDGELVEPGPLPATGLPSELVERRPDVRRAYRALLASDERLWAARADRLPRVSLTGTAVWGAGELDEVLDNWVTNIAAGLTVPVIDGGRRVAEVDRNRALVSERVRGYVDAVLVSLREVEDALVQEREQRALIVSLERQLELARQTLEQIRDRYTKGVVDYLDVLGALASVQNLESSVLTARRGLVSQRIALHRALAGGFALDSPPLAGLEAAP